MTLVCAVQLAPVVGDLNGNLQRAAAAIAAASADGAEITVLPELSTSGYVFAAREEAESLSLRSDDDRLSQLGAELKPGAVVVVGYAELAGQRLYNSAAVIDSTGILAVYRKAHLWDREKLIFDAGDGAPPIIETAHGRVGVLICYDLEFPEWSRSVALAGADLIAVPTNWPLYPRPEGERVAEVQIAIATARMNHVAIAFADRTGPERGVAWSEGTGIVSADGWLLGSVGAGIGQVSANLDLSASRDKRQAEFADLFADRRPELYRAALGL